jgi:hypothetical protein
MKKIQSILWIGLIVSLMTTFILGSKLSSPYLSASIVLSMFGLMINKFIIEFRAVK